MKRLLISILTLCVWALCLHAQQGEFDPANPGDPQPFYTLQVEVSPAAGGMANITRTMVAAGQEIALRITPNKGFTLRQWVCGEDVLSTDTYVYYTMPARNVTITAQLLYEPIDFNPTSPSDPEPQAPAPKRHVVTVYVSPSVGGYTNQSSFYMQEGKQQNLYAYNNAGYEFIGWYVGDKLESQSNPVTLTMRESDITLTARFRFNPASPDDPGANMYDASTGTLVIDRFTPGRLSDAVYKLIGNSDYGNVTALTIVGEMTSSDYGVVRNFGNAEVIDLSRVMGYTDVPSWAFEYMNQLQRLLLPATVETIGSNAFYGCSGLKEMVLYAPAPPTAQQNASNLFYSLENELVIHVPAASMALYQASDLWKSFTILPMDMQSLNVTLPEDKVALYENMFLELLDTKSGQLRRYVITKRDKYSFSGVFDETAYQLTLRNAQNKVFGQEMVTFAGKDTTVAFASLLQPVDLSVRVLNDKNEDVTAHTTITWMDKDGKYLTKGTVLAGQVEGEILYYQVSLNETLGVSYQQCDSATRVFVEINKKELTHVLKPLSKTIIFGNVIDSLTNKPIKDATISITQHINGQYIRFFTTTTAQDGTFSISVFNAPTDIDVSNDYYKKRTYTDISIDKHQEIKLHNIHGTNIKYGFVYTPVAAVVDEVDIEDYFADYRNVTFNIYNQTKKENIKEFDNNYTSLQLLQEVAQGDSLEITVNSTNHTFASVTIGKRIEEDNSLSILFPIVEQGGITTIFSSSDAQSVMAMLYDDNGRIIRIADYSSEQRTDFTHLPKGIYTLIAIENNNRYRGISNLQNFANSGLEEGKDYIQTTVEVTDGIITTAIFDAIPQIRQNIISYIGNSSSFTANKTTLVSGNYLTLRGKIDFKKEYIADITNVSLIVDLSESCAFVENSVMIGTSLGNYNVDKNSIEIPVNSIHDQVRFCIIPTMAGEFRHTAYARFTYQENEIMQPIGSLIYSVENASIVVPEETASESFAVSGITTAGADILIYCDNVLIGKTKANASGHWGKLCKLPKSYNMSSHAVYAQIITPDGLFLQTDTKTCVLNKSAILVSKITAYHHNPELNKTFEIVYDFINANPPKNRWTLYYPNKQFTYTIDFTANDPEIISDVILYVHMADGQIVPYVVGFDEKKGKWSIDLNFGSSSGSYYPVSCSIDYNVQSNIYLEREQIDEEISNMTQAIEEALQEREFLISEFWNNNSSLDELDSMLITENADINVILAKANELIGNNGSVTDTLSYEELELRYAQYQQQFDLWQKDSATLLLNETLETYFPDTTYDYISDIFLVDTIDNIVQNARIQTLSEINESQLIEDEYTEIPLSGGKSLYFRASSKGMEMIDAQNMKYYCILQVDSVTQSDVLKNRHNIPNAFNLGILQDCSYSVAGFIRDLDALKNVDRNSWHKTFGTFLSLTNDLIAFVNCIYTGSVKNLERWGKMMTDKLNREYDTQIKSTDNMIEETTASIEKTKKSLDNSLYQYDAANSQKGRILANNSLSPEEKARQLKDVEAKIDKYYNESIDLETKLQNSKGNLKKIKGDKKILLAQKETLAKNSKTINEAVTKYLPLKLTKGMKAPSVVVRAAGSFAGTFGAVVQFITTALDIWDAYDDIKLWYSVCSAIENKIPCPANPEKAEQLREEILQRSHTHLYSHIAIITGEVVNIPVSLSGSVIGSPTWFVGQGLTILCEAGKFFNNKFSTEAQDKFNAQIKRLKCDKDCPNPPCDNEKCDLPGFPPCQQCPGCGGGSGGSNGGSDGSGSGAGGGSHKPNNSDDDVQIDPSGFVYEGVENNRVEGVKATIYYKDTHENMFGEQVEEEVVWDATEYEQENPLYTDAQGMYRWDVPQGLWQVRFEKEGYEPTQSEWLPVPPPQLEVNIPIVQLRQPEVENAVARKDAIDITFDKYMMPELLNTGNILVTSNGKQVAGTVTLLDEQKSYGDAAATFARKVRFVPSEDFTAKQITLTVSNRVRSYADVPMVQTFQQNFDVDGLSALEQAYMPVTSVPAGQISSGTMVELYCATPGAVIRYTLDGTTPDCMHGIVYDGTPVILGGRPTLTVKAIACADGYDPSDVAQWLYTTGTATGIQTQEQYLKPAVKVLENGHLYILMQDGSKHSVLGTRVK